LLIACGAILHNILLEFDKPADNDFDGFEEVGENEVPAETGRLLSCQKIICKIQQLVGHFEIT
jgi:hypothetical protein